MYRTGNANIERIDILRVKAPQHIAVGVVIHIHIFNSPFCNLFAVYICINFLIYCLCGLDCPSTLVFSSSVPVSAVLGFFVFMY